MALPSTTVWELRPTAGNDTNGGGFDSTGSGSDFSQQNAKNSGGNNSSTTDAVANGTTTITSATASFTSAINGNIIYFSGGSGSITGTWRRATFVNSTTITIDASIAASTGMTMNIGGALATPAQVNTTAVAGNTVYVKASGTITVTATVSFNKDSRSLPPYKWIGYTSARGDNGLVSWTTATNSTDLISVTGTCVNVEINNFSFSNTAGTRADGLKAGTTGFMWVVKNCVFDGFTSGIDDNSNNFQPLLVAQCEIKNCTTVGLSNGASTYIFDSYIHANVIGCRTQNPAGSGGNNAFVMTNTIVSSNTSIGCNIASGTVNGSYFQPVFTSCVFYNNTSDGLKLNVGGSNDTGLSCKNCIFYGNGGFGINVTSANSLMMLYFQNNAYGSNTSGNLSNISSGSGDVTLSANPFTNAGSGDFSLNSTAGGGAALKAVGYPGALIGGGTGFVDIGALQSQGTTTTNVFIPASNRTIYMGVEQGDL